MTPRYLLKATGITKLSFTDMGKTMENQVLEQDLEQNLGHINYDLCIRNLIGDIRTFVYISLESRSKVEVEDLNISIFGILMIFQVSRLDKII